MRILARLVLVVATLLNGCATLKNTPQQDATHALFAQCKSETNSSARLLQVYPDGGFTWVKGSDTSDDGMKDCMAQKGRRFEWANTPRGAWGASRLERTKADFEECRSLVYPGATLTTLDPDGTFRWRGEGSPEENQKLKLCLKQKGYRINM